MLIFAIPGIYLEWPADNWEHLRRITEWKTLDLVSGHSAGYKAFYFFEYSLIGRVPAGTLIFFTNLYYVAVSLLLSWQYYLLSRAVSLPRSWAMLFVILNAITFGNSSFSFYRYYGLASTMYSQLGAIALIRTASEWACLRPLARLGSAGYAAASLMPPVFRWFRYRGYVVLNTLLLVILTACGHVQGLMIAACGVVAVLVWRWTRMKASRVWPLLALTCLTSLAVFSWWPRSAAVDSQLRADGWLNAIDGFNLLSANTPAAHRALDILGALGVVGLAAAVVLIRRQQLSAWLAITPPLLLLFPAVAIPVASGLAERNGIVAFHRLLFACPITLPLVAGMYYRLGGHRVRWNAWVLVIAAIAALVSLEPQWPTNNRLWHSLAVAPHDLELQSARQEGRSSDGAGAPKQPSAVFCGTRGAAIVQVLQLGTNTAPFRAIAQPVSGSLCDTVEFVNALRPLAVEQARSRHAEPGTWSLTGTAHRNWTTFPLSPVARDASQLEIREWTTAASLSARSGLASRYLTPLENPQGRSLAVFSTTAVPVDRTVSYQLEMSVRRRLSPEANVYLAIAWYDVSGRFLPSNETAPQGSAHPAGWDNGTYSYFGLAGRPAPATWTRYSVRFGLGGNAIPSAARSFRVGALLNNNSASDGLIQLQTAGIKLERPAIANLVTPAPGWMYTAVSQAALLTHHWAPQHAAIDLAGHVELIRAIHD